MADLIDRETAISIADYAVDEHPLQRARQAGNLLRVQRGLE